jgi:hypothetical protein
MERKSLCHIDLTLPARWLLTSVLLWLESIRWMAVEFQHWIIRWLCAQKLLLLTAHAPVSHVKRDLLRNTEPKRRRAMHVECKLFVICFFCLCSKWRATILFFSLSEKCSIKAKTICSQTHRCYKMCLHALTQPSAGCPIRSRHRLRGPCAASAYFAGGALRAAESRLSLAPVASFGLEKTFAQSNSLKSAP